jgi:hypothetical protein
MEEIGPVDHAFVAFPGNMFPGEIAPALADLREAGTIRLIDVAFRARSESGNAIPPELAELDVDLREALDTPHTKAGA